jgi:uncharacterized protein (DUF927 family)
VGSSLTAVGQFRIAANGIYVWRQDDSPEGGELVWLCDRFEVVALTRDPYGRSWGTRLLLTDPEGNVHEVTVLNREINVGDPRALLEKLADCGLRFATSQKAGHLIRDFVNETAPNVYWTFTNRLGWHGGAYILPDQVYGDNSGRHFVFEGVTGEGRLISVRGSLDDWRQNIGRFCAGNSRLILACSAALAGPLLYLGNEQNGGVHFRGMSQTGKSTALRVAGSIWGGGGQDGYLGTWRATSNGLEAIAQEHNDGFLCLDELGQVDAREAGETAYMLGNGLGKTRSKKEGGVQAQARWRLFWLSSGEVSLREKLAEIGRRAMAGQDVRLIDLSSDAGAGYGLFETLHGFDGADELARHLRGAAHSIYGSPIQAFLACLVDADSNYIRRFIADEIASFRENNVPFGSVGQVTSVASRFGLMVAAGKIGVQFGVLPWSEAECEEAMATCFAAWLCERGGHGSREEQEAIAWIRYFIQMNGASRFAPLSEGASRSIVNRAGFWTEDDAGGRVHIFPKEVFDNEVCQGRNPKMMLDALRDAGHLIPGNDGKPSRVVRISGLGPVRCYFVAASVLAGDDEEVQAAE